MSRESFEQEYGPILCIRPWYGPDGRRLVEITTSSGVAVTLPEESFQC